MAGKKKRDFKNPDRENLALGSAIRDFRKEQQKSQEELAEETKLDRTYISLIERGQRSPTFSTICNICAGLNISLSTLMVETEKNLTKLH